VKHIRAAVLLTTLVTSGAAVVHLAQAQDVPTRARDNGEVVAIAQARQASTNYSFVRLDGPARTAVLDEHARLVAMLTDGGRTAVHEYHLTATADPASLRLLSVEAEPRVLPFTECPAAAPNVERLLGTPLPELRDRVLVELRGTAGCTHLNDALRALAEVPILANRLRTALAA